MRSTPPRTSADTTRRRWWAEATRLGGTSALLDCPEDSQAALDLTTAHPSGLAQLLAGGPAPLSSLVRESGAFAEARRRARATHRLATTLLTQRGTRSLAVAVGTVGWPGAAEAPDAPGDEAGGDDGGPVVQPAPPRRTPLLLRRCTLVPTGEALDDFVVQLAPEVVVNPVLVRVARTELGVVLEPDRIAAAVSSHRGFDPAAAVEEVRRQLSGVRGVRVERRLLLATFADPGADLLAELSRRGGEVRDHRVVRALAVGGPADPVEDTGPTPSRELPGGIALDTAQALAVRHVHDHGDLRLEAPTGTGATQVAAALVAAAVEDGHRVLLVADAAADRRALDERLRDNGFGRLVLHLVGDLDAVSVHAGTAAQTATALAELAARRSGPEPDGRAPDLTATAAPLEDHARALHTPRAPWGVSPHDAMEALAALACRPTAPSSTRRLRGAALEACSREDLAGWSGRLVEAVHLGAFDVSPATTPWAGARLRTDEAAAAALRTVGRVVEHELPAARAQLATVCDAAGLRGASSVAEAHERAELLAGVRETTRRFGPEVFGNSLGDVAAATATPQWRREHGARVGALARWRLRRTARALLAPGAGPVETALLHDWLQQARAQRLAWQRVSVRDATPHVPDGLDALYAAIATVRAGLLELDEVLPPRLLRDLTGTGAETLLQVQLPELQAALRALLADADAVSDLPRRTVLLDELEAGGWQPLLEDLAARWNGPGSLDLAAEVEAAWWSGVLDAAALADPLVGAPDAETLRTARHELQLAEAAARAHAAQRVRRAVDGRAARGLGPLPVTAVSTAAVAALAGAGLDDEGFDLVVVLGAQAVATATALPAVSRGRRLVVIGDPDLPGPLDLPTAGAPAGVPAVRPPAGGSSLLEDTAGVLQTLRLDRQHACLDDTLVAGVLDPEAVQDSLPGSALGSLRLHRTSSRGVGGRRGPDALVDLVTEVVARAVAQDPTSSLGVVVPDAADAALVADAVRRRALRDGLPLVVGREPLLVADPGRWVGERRDHVVVVGDAVLGGTGLGGGEDPVEAVAEVRLALTRSRTRTTVVLDDSGWASAPSPTPGGPTAPVAAGRELLLQLALSWEADGGQRAGGGPGAAGALVQRLAAACRDLGLQVTEAFGPSRPVPLVVRDPRLPQPSPALAVELDGARWAADGVLDREVAGPFRLERRGWRYVRVLEADVHADVDAVAATLLRTWQDALVEQGRDGSVPLERVVNLTGGVPDPEVPAAEAVPGVPAPASPLDVAAGRSWEGTS